jgi:glycosyltransferase involved in cell wall biosynthesis
MSNRGHDVYVLTSALAGQGEITRDAEGFLLERLETGRRHQDRCSKWEMMRYVLRCWIRLPSLIQQQRPDVIHVFFSFPTGAAYWFYKHIYSTPYVISLLGGDVPGFLPNETGAYHRMIAPLSRSLWRNADMVIANSRGLANLAESVGWSPIQVINNGVDLSLFHAQPRKSPSDILDVIFVGRLVHQKGFDILISALASLSPRQIRFRLTVVGDGENRAQYESLVSEKGLADSVHWSGWLPLECLAEIYRQHDILVLPSRFEGMASVTLQALASGCVVISTDVFGAADAIQDGMNGFVIPKDDEVALADALTKLADRAVLARMTACAIGSAPRYSWGVVADQYERLYMVTQQSQPTRRPDAFR